MEVKILLWKIDFETVPSLVGDEGYFVYFILYCRKSEVLSSVEELVFECYEIHNDELEEGKIDQCPKAEFYIDVSDNDVTIKKALMDEIKTAYEYESYNVADYEDLEEIKTKLKKEENKIIF